MAGKGIAVDDRAQVELFLGDIHLSRAHKGKKNKPKVRNASGNSIQRAKSKAFHEAKAQCRCDRRSQGGRHAKIAHALCKTGAANHIGGNGCRGRVGEGQSDAVKHAEGDTHRKDRHEHIAQRRGAQEEQAYHERHFTNTVIEPPAYKRPDDYGYKGKGCRADACDRLAATQALDIEREGGEAHDVVGEDAEVHQNDEHQVARPKLGGRFAGVRSLFC